MEYISGRDMSRIIPKAEKAEIPFPMIYALKIGVELCCDGLYYAHTKTDAYGQPAPRRPSRCHTRKRSWSGWNGNVKILDFGIAKATTQTDQTRAGEIKGKLSYMSPEQGDGQARSTNAPTSSRSASCCTSGSPATSSSPARTRWRS
jgi:serine/threonine protein kinase